jgi:hypothetical protein
MPINFNHNKNTIIADDGLINFDMTGAIKVPLGTTAQQPAGITGRIRFNTTTNFFEGYDGTSWVLIGNTDADTWDGFQFADYLDQPVRTTDTVTFSNLSITNNITTVDSIQFDTTASETPAVGKLSWNDASGTLNLGLAGGNVVIQVGEEVVVRIYNNTGATLSNGDAIRITGSFGGNVTAELADASSQLNSSGTIGIVTENILDATTGFATIIGLVRDVDTSAFTAGDEVWLSITPGEITNVKPQSPDHPVRIGWVSISDVTEGVIFVNVTDGSTAVDVSYDNNTSLLIASNVQSAIDELQDVKASVAQLSSNILLYGTTAIDGGSGYNVSVTSQTDPNYDEPAIDATTPPITSDTVPTLITSFISPVGLIDGSIGSVTATSVGNIRQLTGGVKHAYFFAEYYKRESGGTETLIGTTAHTIPVTDVTYNEYSSSALLTSTIFGNTDHFVTKLYGLKETAGGLDPTYDIQIGGSSPARTLLPVPVSVIPSDVASDILLDTSNFTAILSGADSNVQLALDTLDDHTHAASSGTVVIQDEGVQIDATADTLNFVGAGVTVTSAAPGEVDITITQTDLGYTAAASTGTVTSSDGTDATLPAATISLAGLLTGADKTKLDAIEAGATADQTAGEIEAIVGHDNLIGFVANEHIDWTTDQGATNIDAGNYTDTNTTYVSSDFDHNALTNYVAAEHIDWALTNAANIHPDNYTDTVYTHPSDGVDLGAALTGANVISDVNVNTAGHVTGFATRAMTASDVGAIPTGDIALGTSTSGNYVEQGATAGNGISGAVNSEGGTFTVTSNATNLNTASTIVYRDVSGNFAAGTITAELSGNASTATTAAAWTTGRTITLTGDVTAVSGPFDGSGDLSFATTIATNSVALGTHTTGPYVQQGATAGNGLSGSVNVEAGTFTVTSNATNLNTASTLVFRDASGDFSAGSITAAFIGDGSGLTNVNAVAITPPGSPVLGDFWYNSETGGLFIYYTDITPDSYWVQVGGADGAGTAGSSGASPFVDTGTYVYYGGPRNVGIGTATPTEALHVIGNILASEDVTAYSDESLKTNISTISDALNIVTQLRGVNYTKKSTQRGSIGVIAQEVQKILPSVVHVDPETGLLSVAYGNMVGVLIEAIKEQQDEIVELKQQMNDMMKRLDKLDGGN